MEILQDKHDCCGCGACTQKCPRKCIVMKPDPEGFQYPEINGQACHGCGVCKEVCFVNQKRESIRDYKLFAVKNKNDEIRYQSSSGGMFTILAEYILEQNGAVFGAGFDEQFVVRHSVAQHKDQLQKFRKSKYIQSDIGDTFIEAKKYLDEGRKVLFSGVPCQIAGLKAFLGKEYDELYAVDLICTGVSSPMVWNMYLHSVQKSMDAKPISVILRDKEINMSALAPHEHNLNVKVLFENGEQIYQRTGVRENQNEFFHGFLKHVYLRPSCYQCSAKGFTSGSDIQLGDFWGIRKKYPEFCDRYTDGTIIPFGVSEVFTITEKGKELFDKVKDRTISIKVDGAELHNQFGNLFWLERSAPYNPNRERFFKELLGNPEIPINDLIRKHIIGFDVLKLKECVKKGSPLILFGAGAVGQRTLALLNELDFKIDYFCDNAENLWGEKIKGVTVISPGELGVLNKKSAVTVLITCGYYKEIYAQLVELGISVHGKELCDNVHI